MNLDKLEQLASASIPGPWLYRAKSSSLCTPPPAGTAYTYGDFIIRLGGDDEDTPEQEATIEYIAAMDPDTAKKLIAVARAAAKVETIVSSDSVWINARHEALDALRAALKELDK